MFLGMTLWFSATAATAPIVAEFHLTSAATAWLTMAVQGGFVAGTLLSATLNLPDVINPRRLFAVGCVVGAAANAGLVGAGNPALLIALRIATGAALAWVYPPGMKVAAGWFERQRGAALGVLIGALTVGSAFPHLLAAASATIPWRMLMLSASGLALAGGVIVLAAVGDGPYVATSARFDPRAVVRVFAYRPARLATLGYLGHMWELYAVWTWIAAFSAASLHVAAHGDAPPSSAGGSALAFVTIASGAVGSAVAGLVADRVGKARIASWAMLASGTCAALAGFTFASSPAALMALAVFWGFAVDGDSAHTSDLYRQHSFRDHAGTDPSLDAGCGLIQTKPSIQWATG